MRVFVECAGCLFGEECFDRGTCVRNMLNNIYSVDNGVPDFPDVADVDAELIWNKMDKDLYDGE